MRPILLLGNEKATFDFAESQAQKNNFHFFILESKDFGLFERNFFSSSLDEAKTLFYLSDADKLTVDQFQKFLELATDSPHLFYLASASKINWLLRKNCTYKPLGKIRDEITEGLRILLTEPDRNLARFKLKNADVVYLFHILKFGSYQYPETLDAMIRVSRNLYKVNKHYFLSMLVFHLPPKPFMFGHKKKKENKLQRSIKMKIKKDMPKLTDEKVADIYMMMKSAQNSFGLDLSDEENKFLGIDEQPEAEETQADRVFVQTANLSDYF